VNDFLHDIRYALRGFAAQPLFTAVVVLTLALGIGANTTVFITANAMLFRPFPYDDPDRIVAVRNDNTRRATADMPFSYPDFADVRARMRSFGAVAAHVTQSFNLAAEGVEPERVEGEQISAGLFALLGVRPAMGREFSVENEQPSGPRGVILSDGLWRERFAADQEILERTILLNGESWPVVGVMPPRFTYPADQRLWVPLQGSPTQFRGAHFLDVVARLAPGTGMEDAQAELHNLMARLERDYPESNTGFGAHISTLRRQEVGDTAGIAWTMMIAVGFVLLIACANVANLMLARAARRQREVSIRTALGAGRARLVRLLLTESVLLGLAGGTLGVVVALWGRDLMVAATPADRPFWMEFAVDWRVLLFTFVVAVGTGLLFGLAPALHASRPDLVAGLKDGAQGGGTARSTNRLRGSLVVAEVALSLVLLTGAGLMMRSFLRLADADPGFDRAGALTMAVSLSGPRFDSAAVREQFQRTVLERVREVAGVRAAAFTSSLPLTGSRTATAIVPEGRALTLGEEPEIGFRVTHGEPVEALGLRLRAGRPLTAGDVVDSSRAVLVNETAARRIWPGSDPVGQRFQPARNPQSPYFTVVGVVADAAARRLWDAPINEVWFGYSFTQPRNMRLVVRGAGDPLALAPALRSLLRDVDPTLPVYDIVTMDQVFSDSFWDRRMYGQMFAVFAAVALLLAALGLYGVIAYQVTQRTREIGVRMALGAGRPEVLALVLRNGAALTAVGLGLGLGLTLLVTRSLRGLLYGVSTMDPLVIAAVALALAAVSLAACLVPAARATRIEPILALRNE
jgi:putative ABC transport system permease protein